MREALRYGSKEAKKIDGESFVGVEVAVVSADD